MTFDTKAHETFFLSLSFFLIQDLRCLYRWTQKWSLTLKHLHDPDEAGVALKWDRRWSLILSNQVQARRDREIRNWNHRWSLTSPTPAVISFQDVGLFSSTRWPLIKQGPRSPLPLSSSSIRHVIDGGGTCQCHRWCHCSLLTFASFPPSTPLTPAHTHRRGGGGDGVDWWTGCDGVVGDILDHQSWWLHSAVHRLPDPPWVDDVLGATWSGAVAVSVGISVCLYI